MLLRVLRSIRIKNFFRKELNEVFELYGFLQIYHRIYFESVSVFFITTKHLRCGLIFCDKNACVKKYMKRESYD